MKHPQYTNDLRIDQREDGRLDILFRRELIARRGCAWPLTLAFCWVCGFGPVVGIALLQHAGLQGLIIATIGGALFGWMLFAIFIFSERVGTGTLRVVIDADILSVSERRTRRRLKAFAMGSVHRVHVARSMLAQPQHEPLVALAIMPTGAAPWISSTQIPVPEAVRMVDAIAARIPGPQREQRVAWLARNASTQAHNPDGPTLNYAPVREKTRGPMMTGEPDRFTIVVAYTAWMKKRYARIDLVPDAILIDDNDQHTTVPCDQILIVQINVREGHDDRLALFLRDGSILEVLRGRELFMVQRVLSDYLDLPRPSWEQRQRLWAHE